MTVIAFGLGMAACTASQRELDVVYGPPGAPRPPGSDALATALGIVMLAAGIVAFVLASETMLATLVAAMGALRLAGTGRPRADWPTYACARPPCHPVGTRTR
jgi:hypothetical protein